MNLEQIAVGTTFASRALDAVAPSQRLHLILLGVRDVRRSMNFYEALGWKKSPTGHAGFVKFDLGGHALCLLPVEDFAKDALADETSLGAFNGIGLVHLAKCAEDVARILAKAVAAGGSLVKPATRTPWGIAGYFKDPDGHLSKWISKIVGYWMRRNQLVVDRLNPS